MARKITLTKTHVLKANEFQETTDFPDQNVPFVYDTTKKYVVRANSIAEGQSSMFYDKINGDLDVGSIVEEAYTYNEIINYNSEVYWANTGDTNMGSGVLLKTGEPGSNINSITLNLYLNTYDYDTSYDDPINTDYIPFDISNSYTEFRLSYEVPVETIGDILIVFELDNNGNLTVSNFIYSQYDGKYMLKLVLDSIKVNYNN